jgi:hypothetical protein
MRGRPYAHRPFERQVSYPVETFLYCMSDLEHLSAPAYPDHDVLFDIEVRPRMKGHFLLDTHTFRNLVDKAIANHALADQRQVVAHFVTALGGAQPANRSQALYTFIGDAIGLNSGDHGSEALRSLQRSVFLEGALGKSRDPYLAIIGILADACRTSAVRSFAEEDSWIAAIDAARGVVLLSGPLHWKDPRHISVGDAAVSLVDRGYGLSVENGHFAFDPGEMDRLCDQLERAVVDLGGLVVIEETLAHLKAVEPLQFGRYAPGRVLGSDHRAPSLPIGYLLQLGAKHLNVRPAEDPTRSALWREVATLSSLLCAVLDVEPYTTFESIFLGAEDIPDALARIALFDHLFALKQWPPAKARELLEGVTAALDSAEIKSRLGWDMGDVLTLMEAVLAVATGPFYILEPTALRAHGVTEAVWQELAPVFTHALTTMNRDYRSPLNADKAELDFKPLFELPCGRLLVLTPGLAALAFFEATTRAIRDAGYPDFDNRLGDAVEGVVADALRREGVNVTVQGIEYHTGKIGPGKVAGECDIVVETERNIVFIELKKKPLRRASGTGDAAPALVDLTTSLFAAQAQLSRHEQTLLETGAIDFDNGYRLKHRGRSIERIAMTWLDYGGLQDKYLLSQIFGALPGHRLTTDHPKEGNKLEKLNSAIDALEREITALRQLGKNNGALFINCWFLSVPQLLLLLDGVTDGDDFAARIGKLRHLTYRTLDFYRDFGFARRSNVI